MKKALIVFAAAILVLAAALTFSASAEAEDYGLDLVTVDAASIRLSDESGVRFLTTLSSSAWDTLKSDPDVAHLKVGTLIAPTAYVEAAGAFTKEALEGISVVSGAKYIEVETAGLDTIGSNWWTEGESDGVHAFVGSIVALKENHYNTAFSAIGYVKITYVGGTTETVYASSYATRTIREVARKILMLPVKTLTQLDYDKTQLGLLYDFGAARLEFDDDLVTGIGDYAGGDLIIPTVTPDGKWVSGVDWMAFAGCESITSLTFGDGASYIDGYAFAECPNLMSVKLPDTMEMICEDAFLNCPCVTTVNGVSYVDTWAVGCPDDTTDVVIREGTQGIADVSFSGNRKITSVTLPSSVRFVGFQAFYGCNQLMAVRIGSLAKWCNIAFNDYYANPLCCAHDLYLNGVLVTDLVIPSGITKLPDYAFVECNSMTSLTLPDSVTAVGTYACYGCRNLETLDLGTGVKTISSYSFYGCKKLTSLTVPNGVKTVSVMAFAECSALAEITLPEGIQQIGMGTFRMCVSLKEITIPESTAIIGYEAFARCTELNSVVFLNPNGWWYTDDTTATSGPEITGLDDPATAAEHLKTTYYDFYWRRTAQPEENRQNRSELPPDLAD